MANEQWALVSKVHYSIIDGVSGTDVLGLLADDVDAHESVGRRMPAPVPGPTKLVADAVTDLVFDPVETARAAYSVATKPLRAAQSIVTGVLQAGDPNSLGRSVGPHRKWQSAKVPLDRLRAARDRYECSTTDVILACVAGGVRTYLSENGKPLPTSINVVVPLAVGAATGGFGGQVTTLSAELPIAELDAANRLAAIHEQTSSGAAASGAIAGRVLRRQENFVAPSILAQGVRSTMLEARGRRRPDTVAINVPGPEKTIEILGHPMVETYPVIPLATGVRMAMAAMSLEDTVYFGITADFDSTKGLRHASIGVSDTVTELLA